METGKVETLNFYKFQIIECININRFSHSNVNLNSPPNEPTENLSRNFDNIHINTLDEFNFLELTQDTNYNGNKNRKYIK